MRIKWFSLIRITGLILVLTYHFFQTKLTGGFIGVDVFFTFSGFLITALMVDEFGRSNRFELISFYRRRFYRIVPPLLISILLVIPFTFLINRQFTTNIGGQIVAALGFTTNYFEIANGGSYESKFVPHLFVHTWSLAVEMHFYIIWGIIVFFIAKTCRRFSTKRALPNFRITLGITAVVLAALSFLMMDFGTKGLTDFSKIYFSSTTHSFPFFVGCLFGTMGGIKYQPTLFKKITRYINRYLAISLMTICALYLLYLSYTLKFDQVQVYQGGLLIASIIAGVMIIGARILHDQTTNIAEPRWITFLADVSYSVYLFHWPLYVIFSQLMKNWQAALLTTILSIIFSALSYYVLEPLIAGKNVHLFYDSLRWSPLRLLFAGSTLILAVVTGVQIKNAPKLTTLEQNLWVSGIYQSVDKIDNLHGQILADSQSKDGQNVSDIPKGVTIIGDSVTLGTRQYLSEHVANSDIDAEGERTMDKAYDIMMSKQRSNLLRKEVIICIGTNSLDDYELQMMKIVKDLNPGHKLIFMTPYNSKAESDWNSSKLTVLEKKLPEKFNFITIANWDQVAGQNPEVFAGTDGVHFGGRLSGDELYAKVINTGLLDAKKTEVKK
ncbi:acyltransferase [Paucilactobacillus oligofermentans DSM 15707 = LMG 22743]|uniref:Acyltransferase n=1 Tax=Paucilactobacillus oligofermentans DSM 15707 = LMG 22743 TaxID=1423778 RepID=A0A0R1RE97_9LACO|nr:acyltransferase family protein [Paucilactobacillus oligofermentans]KRL55279.1 acyltransferase [Paucilactobacillus oligofermentans DSM 15707 = LMG 22743]CUS25730.1 Putative O-acetyltransferase [Paucilactobacillus oligofermentans DSM 15707 = LMG 22743]